MQKITGIGGVIFKAKNPDGLRKWYQEHLGLEFQHGYLEFKWEGEGSTVFAISKEDSEQFKPSEKPYLINFRVADLRSLLAELKAKGVTVVGEIQEMDFGRFGSIMDPEGNKIELWEPIEH